MPKVPMISKYTPICEMRPRKLTPPMLNASCTRMSSTVQIRI